MQRHLAAAAAGLGTAAFVGLVYYGFNQAGYPPVHAFGVFSIVMAVSLGGYFWYYFLKYWDQVRQGKWDKLW